MMKIGKHQITLPGAIILAALLVSTALVLTWGPTDSRTHVIEWITRAIAVAALFVRPLLVQATDGGTDGSNR